MIVNIGSPINGKAILIVKTLGIGLKGNEYIPFPTKNRSR